MELSKKSDQNTIYEGVQSGISVVAGQRLKIETTPGGVEILNDECPAGKAWSYKITVHKTENVV